MRRLLVAALLVLSGPVSAQARPDLTRERVEFAAWLASNTLSPYAALAVQPVGPGITLGNEPADVILSGVSARVTEERGALVLVEGSRRQVLPRGRPVTLGNYQVVADGEPGRRVVVIYGAVKNAHAPEYYPGSELRVTVQLSAPGRKGSFRTLGLDGVETLAEEVGMATVSLGSTVTALRVYRMGPPEDDEAELMIFFRDATSGKTTYPAGRFVVLDPAGGGKYTIDFNKARNPFCAYNTVFPCPAPWPGNTIPVAIEAGEKYGK